MNYEEMVERFRFPKHKGIIKNGLKGSASNTPCGDKITIYLLIKDRIVKDAKYDGTGCVLSNASAELLCENIIGLDKDSLKNISYDDIIKFLGFIPSVGRSKCAETPLNAMRSIIKGVVGHGSDRKKSKRRKTYKSTSAF